jgi:hypothetical protein
VVLRTASCVEAAIQQIYFNTFEANTFEAKRLFSTLLSFFSPYSRYQKLLERGKDGKVGQVKSS